MNRSVLKVAAGAILLSLLGGCGSDDKPAKDKERSFPGAKITVAAVGDTKVLTAAKAWRTTWERETGAAVTFLDEAVDPKDLKGADVVLFPGDRMGELVDSGVLHVINDSDVGPPIPLGSKALPPDPLSYSDITPGFRDQVSKYGEDRMGLPIGGTGLVVVYRRDAFESEANRAAAKAEGLSLEPPRAWKEFEWEKFDGLIRFFHEQGGGKPAGVAAALGPDGEGVGDAIVLARAAALGQHPDHYGLLFDPETLEPRIASPPFVEAVSAIAAWKGSAPPKGETFDAEAARASFRAGEAVFLIDLAEKASSWTDPKRPLSVEVVALPGSRRVYDPGRKAWSDAAGLNRVVYLPRGGGWIAGMRGSSTGAARVAAVDFIRSLASPETSRQIVSDAALPMLPIRNSQVGGGLPNPRSAQGVDSNSWATAVAKTVTAPRIVPGLRIPGADRYLVAFAKARAAAVNGAPPESALADAAKEWASISRALGIERQLWHYRRSLNKLITDPKPPGIKGQTPPGGKAD